MFTMGNTPIMHVSNPDLVKDISHCLSIDLGRNTFLKETLKPLLGDGIFKANGETWSHQKRIIAPEFYLDKVKVIFIYIYFTSKICMPINRNKFVI